MNITANQNELLNALDVVARKTMAMDLIWDWPCGVAYYGISQAFEITKNEEYINFLKDFTDKYISLGLPDFNVNACAMGHCLITLYEYTNDEKYWDIVMGKIDYIRNHALRFGDNVLQHTVSSNNDFPEQAWADTLFMAAYFLLRVGVKISDKEMIDDALNQYYWHIKYLQDPATGLWYHGYNNINKDHMSGFYWARANAWAAYTLSRVKVVLPEPYLYPKYMDIDCALRDQLSVLKIYQTEGGLWRTIVDEPESYEEVSASCGIAAAMIINGNPLHTEYVNKALKGILNNISDDGRVLNVSGGTAVMKTKEDYCQIPRTWAQGWGQGLCLAFLASCLRAGGKE